MCTRNYILKKLTNGHWMQNLRYSRCQLDSMFFRLTIIPVQNDKQNNGTPD